MDPIISFRASARKTKNIKTPSFLEFYQLKVKATIPLTRRTLSRSCTDRVGGA